MTEAQTSVPGPYVALKRHVRTVTVPGEAVFMWSDREVTAVRGAGAEALVSLLDGSRTLSELLRDAAAAMPVDQVGLAVRRLAEANLVGYRHGAEAEPGPDLAYWDRAGLDGALAGTAVRARRVALICVGDVDAEQARAACRASGISLTDADAETDAASDVAFALVLCDDYLAPELAAVQARLRAAGRPWLLARPFAAEPWTGPVFDPAADTACWSCLTHRLRAHRGAELEMRRAAGLDAHPGDLSPSLAAVRAIGLHSAVLETVKWLAGLRGPQQQEVSVLDSLTLRATHHPVRRRPQCPDCGDPGLMAERAQRPVRLEHRPKARDTGGNDRALSAREMLSRHRHLIGPVTGIVTEVRPMTGLPEGLHAYDSGPNLALRGHSPAGVRRVQRSRSSGKGVTAVEARVSALCEAVERYCGALQGDECTVTDSLRGLGDAALHPNAYQLFHERQFADRDRWNQAHTPFHHVSRPLDPDAPIRWTPVWTPDGKRRLLPTSTLYFDSGATDGLWADSNGNAAGSSLEDAVVQGFLELVERDAVALWWYNRLRLPGIDLDAFDAPWLTPLRERLHRAGREVWALDLTSDLGIPVVMAASGCARGTTPDVVYGFGAHFDPATALRRALTEMIQMLPAAAAGHAPCAPVRPHLLPDPGQRGRGPSAWPAPVRNDDLRADVDAVGALVAAHGMELLILDQTRPDVAVPAVKVLVPGLRPFYARYAPGRLYDVPVSLGQLDRPTAYDQLNPVPLLL
ncbi:TOMM precursor leader peptide-binding protein [Streptomyces sp. NPDC046716]|uniref:TOMM precursor leader peptide-binding protein n=1 Tax=Streptomyces sp. NPDC046716 TaxID=3157093 RepID=UPI003405DDCF